ncbi:5957_t:CDS:2 [Paraglomus brasilianum]|uniref:Aldehyde dehydrogenase n=1 Tax=Paraglomus brasilianum TaxID=144538 RepID=A0A9N9BP42_9GLOM|nr:5957_t:CDS:2 [Paraglomus brasilianum]
MTLTYTVTEAMPQIVEDLRKTFRSNVTKPLSYRKAQLKQLYLLLDENENLIFDAVHKDGRKPRAEAWLGETVITKEEIVEVLKNLDNWAASEYVKVGMGHMLNSCHVRKEPVGTVLIIGSWNYPIALLLGPLIGAIAAGCTAICKPSEIASHTAVLLDELLPKYLDQSAYRIVHGGPEETAILLKCKFDHIFYTGSGSVGKSIMAAAANHLTRVTLELGGKSPVIVGNDADPSIVAKRVAWGKFFNCGQTCIAPDYIICERSMQEALLKHLPMALKELYGGDVKESPDYARLVSSKHFDRLANMLTQTQGRVAIGGETDLKELYISPTIVADVSKDDILMQDELFGPVLPIVVVDNLDDAIDYVNSKDSPLTIYPFSKNSKTIEYSEFPESTGSIIIRAVTNTSDGLVLENTRSGAAVTNDVIMHFSVTNLPFGGVGASGIGSYHGKKSFDTFTHERSTMNTPYYAEKFLEIRYPPYKENKLKMLQWLFFSKRDYRNNKSVRIFTLKKFFGYSLIVVILAYSLRNSNMLESLVNFIKAWFKT